MRTVIYRGPGHVLVAGDRTIRRGEPTEVSNALYDQLARDASMTLELVEPEPETPAEPAATDTADNGEEESD